uniref:Uncharacterized protein n=1 Tax=Heterorhabditis bacteriophora TaxID=37862 RepID=A0A1I7WKE0_HETBA
MSCRQDRWCSSKFNKIVTIINKCSFSFRGFLSLLA